VTREFGDLIPTRRSLLDRLKNWEDQESWREFFDTYWRLIYGVAMKAGLTDSEAQEVVQETVIAVAKKMQGFKYDPSIGPFKSWLLHTTRWKISDQFRNRIPEGASASPNPITLTGTAATDKIPDPASCVLETVWDDEWRQTIFDAALERVKLRVKAEQVQIFDLYVVKNWPVLKVARTLGVSIARVYLAKHRVSALLRQEVKALEKTMA
jgi:RNA polymerase sigma-70 factor (ECF subfamily)